MMQLHRRRLLAGALLGVLLAGCATPSIVPHAAPVLRIAAPAFELEGRLSATDKDHAASGRLSWQHQRHSDRWTVFSPLGQIVAQLDSDASGARLIAADGRHYRAASADELLPTLLGIEAPLSLLPAWVQATPGAQAEVRQRDAQGRPSVVIEAGWRLEYPEYATEAPDALPRRINASRGDARLRLVVDQWTPLP